MKLVPVNEVFDVKYGTSLELNALEERDDGVPFVSRTAQNNGVSAYVAPVPDIEPLSGGVLSVALSGSPLATFLQEQPFYTGYHVAVLSAKSPMTRDVMLYYAACLQANRYRFSYGRQANRSLASLLIPDLSKVPSWVGGGLTEKSGSLWHDLRTTERRLAPPSKVALPMSNWKSFSYDELFEVKKGKRLTKDDMSPGSTLYIGATELNNGVTEYIGQDALHPGGQLTVTYDGSIGEAFYQPYPFWASDAVNVFYPRFEMSPEVALFMATLIRQEKYRYNYGRKWKLEVMKASTVRLPVKSDGTPDWTAMENIVRGCGAHAALSQLEQDMTVLS